MPAPREQGGRLREATRLLQEGLELLDRRSREVDALVHEAEQRARQITADAEQRAAEITADAEQRAAEITAEAERRRSELEEQLAALRAEIATVREELAQLRAAPPPEDGLRPTTAVAVDGEDAEIATETVESAEAADEDGTPRWGRRSSIAAGQQAIRTRSARPRWLPPWLTGRS